MGDWITAEFRSNVGLIVLSLGAIGAGVEMIRKSREPLSGVKLENWERVGVNHYQKNGFDGC